MPHTQAGAHNPGEFDAGGHAVGPVGLSGEAQAAPSPSPTPVMYVMPHPAGGGGAAYPYKAVEHWRDNMKLAIAAIVFIGGFAGVWAVTSHNVRELANESQRMKERGGAVTAADLQGAMAQYSPYVMEKGVIQAQFRAMDEKITEMKANVGAIATNQAQQSVQQTRMDLKLDLMLNHQGIKVPGPGPN